MISVLLPFCCAIWLVFMFIEDIRKRYVHAVRYACMTLLASLIMVAVEIQHRNINHVVVFCVVIAAVIVQLIIFRPYVRAIFQPYPIRELQSKE